jgi:hypothetical protein
MDLARRGYRTHGVDHEGPGDALCRSSVAENADSSASRRRSYPIVNTTYRPGDFSHGLSRLIADFLLTRDFDATVVDGWLADLLTIEECNSSLFSLNRYFFSVEKT